jgi:hypothetical protein
VPRLRNDRTIVAKRPPLAIREFPRLHRVCGTGSETTERSGLVKVPVAQITSRTRAGRCRNSARMVAGSGSPPVPPSHPLFISYKLLPPAPSVYALDDERRGNRQFARQASVGLFLYRLFDRLTHLPSSAYAAPRGRVGWPSNTRHGSTGATFGRSYAWQSKAQSPDMMTERRARPRPASELRTTQTRRRAPRTLCRADVAH